ncbi:carboxymuconolactone decarboxylase family protein [Parachryseolinea silvisoli]|uniref:carboxymuconolactone decarboxylase family protein n=1 Tax=Parachryseolinea silvisoli TaxID=2873601 RepID=UPI002265B766|nr:carboxymuconolactone decarboxylase family protein [Parachryseolinea silvisoli]MCD9019232.1 carboxymuconolactone decarboxylase family protein [Parachryseolinea silvisoli]
MKQRTNFYQKSPNVVKLLFNLSGYLSKSTVEPSLLQLVNFRVSQLNGCAFCLNADTAMLRASGETEQRLYVLNAWREAPFYTERERAALAWAEAVTNIRDGHVPDEVYETATNHFSEEELIDLTLTITTTNTYNRFNISFRTPADVLRPWEKVAEAR